jgi:uncharacterized repeat protein (TIGR03803 family)
VGRFQAFARAALWTAALAAWSSTANAQVRLEEVHAFSETRHHSPLMQATDGNFYGTVYDGSAFGLGTVFRVTSDGTYTVLHEFAGGSDGAHPHAALTQGPDGMLYGTTIVGGPANLGTIFRMTLSGTVSIVHAFTNGDDGAYPYDGGLTRASDGSMYGTSKGNCMFRNCGSTFFRLETSGSLIPLHTFENGYDSITGRLIESGDGNFYATTMHGGRKAYGSILRITRTGVVTTVYEFTGGADQSFPQGGLVAASDGNMYGTTPYANGVGFGTVFRITPAGSMTVLHTFAADVEGGWPLAHLIQARDGLLYGTTSIRGANDRPGYGGGSGSIFRISPDGDFTVLHRFPSFLLPVSAAYPDVALVEARDGRIYGVANGGAYGGVFRMSVGPSIKAALDTPRPDARVADRFVISGWAFDRTAEFDAGIDTVHVWAYPTNGGSPVFVGASELPTDRPDVAAIFGDQFARAGFTVRARGLAPGRYRFVATPHSSGWREFDHAAAVSVTATVTRPRTSNVEIAIDTPGAGAIGGPTMTIAGWALDDATFNGPGVDAIQTYAYPNPGSGAPPIFLGAGSYGGVRPDVAAIFGTSFTNVGYSLTAIVPPPGLYQLVVFARSTISGLFSAATKDITVPKAGRQAMWIDTPGNNATVVLPFAIQGWAIDLDADTVTGVDAVYGWAIPGTGGPSILLGAATYGGLRPDVGAAFGSQFTNSGYALTVPRGRLPAGVYTIVLSVHSSVTGTYNQMRSISVTVF